MSSDNEKLSVMEWCSVWEPALPLSPGVLGETDQSQLLWGLGFFGQAGEMLDRGGLIVNIGTLGMRGT